MDILENKKDSTRELNLLIEEMQPDVVYAIDHNSNYIKKLKKNNRTLKKKLRIVYFANIILIIGVIALSLFATHKFEELSDEFTRLNEKYEETRDTSNELDTTYQVFTTLSNAYKPIEGIPPVNTPIVVKPSQTPAPIIEEPEPNVSEVFAEVPLEEPVKAYICESAEENGIPPEVLFSQAWKESTFTPDAVSATNDHGLFQINEVNFSALADHFGISIDEVWKNIYDPYFNTDCAVYVLEECLNNYNNGSWHQVLMRYNMGPGGAQKQFNSGNYSSSYSREVLTYAQENYNFTEVNFS